MNSLNTQEKNVGVESSKCVNVHATPIADRASFDGVTIAFHWTTVVLVLALLTTALLHAQSYDDPTKALLLRIHQSVGVAVWMTTALRLVWRITNAKLPPFPDDMTRLDRAFVQTSEYCLYVLLLIQPTTGLIATITRGRSFVLFWWDIPSLMPHYPALQVALLLLHRVGAWTLVALITGHAVTALIHYFVLRDNVLQRMAPIIGMQRSLGNLSLHARVRISRGGSHGGPRRQTTWVRGRRLIFGLPTFEK
jgi:superoxide oxidase